MLGYLIKDTTVEERKKIVEESLGNISADCDGCMSYRGKKRNPRYQYGIQRPLCQRRHRQKGEKKLSNVIEVLWASLLF